MENDDRVLTAIEEQLQQMTEQLPKQTPTVAQLSEVARNDFEGAMARFYANMDQIKTLQRENDELRTELETRNVHITNCENQLELMRQGMKEAIQSRDNAKEDVIQLSTKLGTIVRLLGNIADEVKGDFERVKSK